MTLLSDGREQERREDGSAGGSHPAWAPHMIQGWTPDFIPLVAQESIDKGFIDEVVPVSAETSFATAQSAGAKKASSAGFPAAPPSPPLWMWHNALSRAP